MNDVIGRRDLGRAALHRHHLLRRTAMTAAEMLEHLVGQQARVPKDPLSGAVVRDPRRGALDVQVR